MKTVVILGATGAIGKCLVEKFKKENLIVAGRRNPGYATFEYVDLADFKSVKQFVNTMEKRSIDLFFINSGTAIDKAFTKDGVEVNFMVNCFAPYYIVKHISGLQKNCTFILTSSVSILRAKLSLQGRRKKALYRTSKFYEHMLFHHLEQEDKCNKYVYAHPGIVGSGLSYSLHGKLVGFFIKHWGNTPEKGVQCLVEAAKLDSCSQAWVCPDGWFHLRGNPKKYRIKRNLELSLKELKTIKMLEEKLEVIYGI